MHRERDLRALRGRPPRSCVRHEGSWHDVRSGDRVRAGAGEPWRATMHRESPRGRRLRDDRRLTAVRAWTNVHGGSVHHGGSGGLQIGWCGHEPHRDSLSRTLRLRTTRERVDAPPAPRCPLPGPHTRSVKPRPSLPALPPNRPASKHACRDTARKPPLGQRPSPRASVQIRAAQYGQKNIRSGSTTWSAQRPGGVPQVRSARRSPPCCTAGNRAYIVRPTSSSTAAMLDVAIFRGASSPSRADLRPLGYVLACCQKLL
jgi:hypothetical protein